MNLEELEQRIESLRAMAQRRGEQEDQTAQIPDSTVDALEELQVSLVELRAAEEELRQQNEELLAARLELEVERRRYQDLFERAPDGYLVTDLNGKILEANRAAALVLNVDPTFLVGKVLAAFVSVQDRPHFRRRLNRIRAWVEALQDRQTPSGRNAEGETYTWEEHYREWELALQPRKSAPVYVALILVVSSEGPETRLRWSVRDITERRLAQSILGSSELRFKTLAETGVTAIFLVQDGEITYANPAAAKGLGYPLDALAGMQFAQLLEPRFRGSLVALFARQQALAVHRSLLEPAFSHLTREEWLFLSHSGEECWMDTSVGMARLEEEWVWVITAYDITQRMQAEGDRRRLLDWLLTVQEEERSRLSRELHDQMGQRLTALTLGLKALEGSIPGGTPQRETLQNLQHLAGELGEEVHRVAFDLRPTSLDDLGLRSALRNYAEEWSERTGIPVDFVAGALKWRPIPPQIASAVYRIVQETLTNVIKHAGASRVSLILDQHASSLKVIIEDNGSGFDVESVLRDPDSSRRLGLLGMQERVALLGGTLTIESVSGKGTTVYASVPLLEAPVEK